MNKDRFSQYVDCYIFVVLLRTVLLGVELAFNSLFHHLDLVWQKTSSFSYKLFEFKQNIKRFKI